MKYTPIQSIDNIDIDRHAVIEASAGTGKTYTIENLVVKILVERADIDLENILLVTFTEKAACELKIRIREKLEAVLDKDPEAGCSEKIKTALDAFDSASIYTIHGFCQSVLRDYAFENRAPFQWEVIDDGPLHEKLLKEQIRKTWPETFGPLLSDILELSGFADKKDRFERAILKTARAFDPASGDRMVPSAEESTVETTLERVGRMREIVLELKTLAENDGLFCAGFEDLQFHKTKKGTLLKNAVIPLRRFFDRMDPEKCKLSPILAVVDFLESKDPGYLEITFAKNKANPEACPMWETAREKLETLVELRAKTKDVLAARSVIRLREDVRAEKLKNGWISFDDMLSHVREALYSKNGDKLAGMLREKYKAAFVDEFQDTDPVQWQIFRKVFIENDGPAQTLLFVIGDPKQAIYAFRGADVFAYLNARKEMERLAEKGMANCYSLETNWRSEPRLIDVFNRLFGDGNWFSDSQDGDDFRIGYTPVRAPDEDKRIFCLKQDLSDSGFLNIVDLNASPSAKTARLSLSRFIAAEIGRLMSSGGLRYDQKDRKDLALDFGDICILARSRNETPFLERELTRRNIPYSYYKKPGLFSSAQAFHLSLVFHAIQDPGDVAALRKALLTPFFDFRPEELHFLDDLSPSHPVKQLFFDWNEKAAERRWGLLFQSMMEDSGLVFRESAKSDWERRHTDYRQILEHLQEVSYEKNLDFRGLAATLDAYRKGGSAPEQEADLHRIETEKSKVQIMTMHVAKGLEFPVVFVLGGLTQPVDFGPDCHVFHELSGDPPLPVKTVDLSRNANREKAKAESEDENARLFYVALTRARFKLYVPCYAPERNHGTNGPVCGLLTPALRNAFGEDPGDSGPARRREAEPFRTVEAEMAEAAADGEDRPGTVPGQDATLAAPSPLFPAPGDFLHRKIELASFSSIHNRISRREAPEGASSGFSTIGERPRDDELQVAAPAKVLPAAGGPDDIPGGTETGSMFHDILENISFGKVKNMSVPDEKTRRPLLEDPETRELIESKMDLYRVDPGWIGPVSDVVFNTLRSPVPQLSGGIELASLSRKERIHEAEFYFPSQAGHASGATGSRAREGFVRGFVDLIFIFNGKFYIADWKSNTLEDGYGMRSMEESMTRAGYHLQYRIYTVAVLKWLSRAFGDRFDPARDFGGVFYFYIRGMGGENGEGVYHVPGSVLGPLGELERSIPVAG